MAAIPLSARDAEVVTLTLPAPARVTPRLRFDKGVMQLTDRLRALLAPAAPGDVTVVITCTAPIRLAVKTAEAIDARVRRALAKPPGRDIVATIHDNAVRIRLAPGRVKDAGAVAVFVHNPDPGVARALLDMAEAMVRALSTQVVRSRRALMLANPHAPVGDVWRRVYAAIDGGAGRKVVMTFADGSSQTLSD
jgi:hypothetical protein